MVARYATISLLHPRPQVREAALEILLAIVRGKNGAWCIEYDKNLNPTSRTIESVFRKIVMWIALPWGGNQGYIEMIFRKVYGSETPMLLGEERMEIGRSAIEALIKQASVDGQLNWQRLPRTLNALPAFLSRTGLDSNPDAIAYRDRLMDQITLWAGRHTIPKKVLKEPIFVTPTCAGKLDTVIFDAQNDPPVIQVKVRYSKAAKKAQIFTYSLRKDQLIGNTSVTVEGVALFHAIVTAVFRQSCHNETISDETAKAVIAQYPWLSSDDSAIRRLPKITVTWLLMPNSSVHKIAAGSSDLAQVLGSDTSDKRRPSEGGNTLSGSTSFTGNDDDIPALHRDRSRNHDDRRWSHIGDNMPTGPAGAGVGDSRPSEVSDPASKGNRSSSFGRERDQIRQMGIGRGSLVYSVGPGSPVMPVPGETRTPWEQLFRSRRRSYRI